MLIVDELPPTVDEFDYIIVGGGTAGCVIASRLAENLPDKSILVIEGGPSDFEDDSILSLRKMVDLWGGDFDYKYASVPQDFGNSSILHSRGKMLGGCSSHNGSIAFQPMEYDLRRWQKAGAEGWTFEQMCGLIGKLKNNIIPTAPQHRSKINEDWITTCAELFDIPRIPDFNKEIQVKGNLTKGVGFISMGYTPEDVRRSSASVAYIHPIIRGELPRNKLTILTNTWVSRILFRGSTACGVEATTKSGVHLTLGAKTEIILSAGAIDSPRLMLLSGLGPRAQLEKLGIPVVHDIPGIGQNLQDHCETMYMWEINEAVPENQVVTGSEVTMVLRRERPFARGDDGDVFDCMFHMFTLPFDMYTKPMGYETPKLAFCVIPNTPRPRSVGSLYLTSADPRVKPALDQRYFTDTEGYDKDTNLFLLQTARKIGEAYPFKQHLKREIAPGPKIVTDEQLCEYGRKVSNTVYHPCGTAKMGNLERDPLAVVDPQLRVRGISKLRVADAAIFPCVTSVNPMLTVLAVGERAAELIIEEAESSFRGML